MTSGGQRLQKISIFLSLMSPYKKPVKISQIGGIKSVSWECSFDEEFLEEFDKGKF